MSSPGVLGYHLQCLLVPGMLSLHLLEQVQLPSSPGSLDCPRIKSYPLYPVSPVPLQKRDLTSLRLSFLACLKGIKQHPPK